MDEVVWRHGTHAFMNMSALVYGEVRNLGVVLGQRRMHGANQSQAVWTDIKSLQSRFLSQLELPATLAAHAKRSGLSLDPTGIRVRPGLFKLSIMSWRLDSPNHPIVGDSRLKILRAGMKAIWSFPPYTFTRLCIHHVRLPGTRPDPQDLDPKILLKDRRLSSDAELDSSSMSDSLRPIRWTPVTARG